MRGLEQIIADYGSGLARVDPGDFRALVRGCLIDTYPIRRYEW